MEGSKPCLDVSYEFHDHFLFRVASALERIGKQPESLEYFKINKKLIIPDYKESEELQPINYQPFSEEFQTNCPNKKLS